MFHIRLPLWLVFKGVCGPQLHDTWTAGTWQTRSYPSSGCCVRASVTLPPLTSRKMSKQMYSLNPQRRQNIKSSFVCWVRNERKIFGEARGTRCVLGGSHVQLSARGACRESRAPPGRLSGTVRSVLGPLPTIWMSVSKWCSCGLLAVSTSVSY